METELEITQAALVAIEDKAMEDVAAARAKAIEEEFGAVFFQRYSDLKRRVALAHPE